MFNLFRKSKPSGTELKLKLTGLHCTSCALTIDGALEDLPGVNKSQTSYAKSQTTLWYHPDKLSLREITQVVKNLGYTVED